MQLLLNIYIYIYMYVSPQREKPKPSQSQNNHILACLSWGKGQRAFTKQISVLPRYALREQKSLVST